MNVALSGKNIIVPEQHVPSSFAETVITYNIPANTGFAQALFYNAAGQLIKQSISKKKAF